MPVGGHLGVFLSVGRRRGCSTVPPPQLYLPSLFSFFFLFPWQFLKTIKRSGLGVAAFYGLRYFDDGSERPDFILNQAG